MPITKSAAKTLKQSEKKRKNNSIKKKRIKEALKNTKNEKELPKAQSVIDKAVKTKYIHKNKAARLKSRLAKKLAKKK
jgi:small subunit ribosomal protein S20